VRRTFGGTTVTLEGFGTGRPPGWLAAAARWLLVIPVLVVLMTLGRSFVVVGAGERAAVFNRFTGVQRGQLPEGMHFLIPWVQYPTVYDVKTHAYNMMQRDPTDPGEESTANDALLALTADGLPVSLDISVLYHVDPERVSKLHQEIGPHFLEKIVRPGSRAEVRMVAAQYPVVDIYGSRRAQMVEEINRRLRESLARSYLTVDEVLLRDVRFSDPFQAAIEQKQVAQQEVERMKFVLDQADKERRRKIIDAEGEAESIRLKAAALARNPQLVEWEYVRSLPTGVKTVITDGRSIVNLGSPLAAAATEAGK